MEKKNIAVIGLGGVGGYFGFKISQLNESARSFNISFVARNETYKIVREKGLTLFSDEHPVKVTTPTKVIEDISELKNIDLILICIKEYDLESVCTQLAKTIAPQTIILPLMNGVDIYDRIRSIIPFNTILPACVYVASHIKEKGVVQHKGRAGKLIFGRDPGNPNVNVEWIVELMTQCGIDFDFKDNAFSDIWIKFFFVASFGLVTAKYNSSIGIVCTDKNQKDAAKEIMEEVKVIADKKSISLPNDIIDKTFEKAATFPPDTPTSLQLDINVKKQNNELELFAGAIISYGRELGIDTAFTQKIYAELKEKIESLT